LSAALQRLLNCAIAILALDAKDLTFCATSAARGNRSTAEPLASGTWAEQVTGRRLTPGEIRPELPTGMRDVVAC
jgi:hypothetical protein